MGLIKKSDILLKLSPPLELTMCEQLIDEFISSEKRYIQQDWEPAQLDGGQFAEIAARIIYHIDSGNLSHSKGFNDCAAYIENEKVAHRMLPRHDAIHIVRALKTIYKFRSQRGAIHISPTYKPNHMDSKLVIECVRWVMNEILRIFWAGSREEAAKTIRELIKFDIPAIGVFDGSIIVQRTDLSAEEEILILLHYAGEIGYSRTAIGRFAQFAPSTISTSLKKLCSPSIREIIRLSSNNYRLTDLGSRRIREKIPHKLFL